jgi:hypothetical protein
MEAMKTEYSFKANLGDRSKAFAPRGRETERDIAKVKG